MKTEARVFDLVMYFSFVTAIVYGFWAKEPVGIVALTLTGGLCLIVSAFFKFVARRMEERPEDRVDAEISDGAGEMGFFSPGSYWPVTLAGAAAITAVAMAFWEPWLIVIGVVMVLIAVGGLVFEYHIGPHHD
jgi:hypothetical protein